MKRLDLVVVGHGMVGHRLCERLVELDRGRRYRLLVLGEEPRPAYDRVHLTDYFAHRSADALALASRDWYRDSGIELRVGRRAVRIDRSRRVVWTDDEREIDYDLLALCTGSAPFVPPIPGVEQRGVFVYRTVEDLDAILAEVPRARRAVVIGGGLLGLEAARAVLDAGLQTHVVEIAPRLMPRQLDAAASRLLETTIGALGVRAHLDKRIARLRGQGGAVTAVELSDGQAIDADLVIVSAGIRPRDELAREAGIEVGPRGGVVVDDRMRTSDERVFAVGEVALHRGMVHGLVGPGYQMADVLARNLTGSEAAFDGADSSARLKLLGTDVASFGDPFQDPAQTRAVHYEDQVRGTYKRLVLSADGRRLLGGILVGEASSYAALLDLTRAKTALSDSLEELGLAGSSKAPSPVGDEARVCSCNGVSAGAIRQRVRGDGLSTLAQVKACTRAGTGCGGCLPLVTDLLQAELKAAGRAVKPRLCEHFAFTRQELFQIVAGARVRSFDELIARHGTGHGCEICKPAVASILASVFNEPIVGEGRRTLQDTNDRFLANMQKNGTYSVVPRVPGGEITPEQLVALGQVAQRYGLYCKITGGQRIDLLGARVEQLPDIWEELVAAGFESGHAYGKAMRTVKSCVGSTWCRYGVQDSTALAIRIEHRYKGVRAPHKLKSAVSGCVRECAEAQGKDFGLIATDKGWNVFVCGNGGASPRHADLLASDVEEDTAIRYLDRFLMFYIRTADRLTRTSVWLDKMEGGIDHLRRVIVDDALGIAADLERDMQKLVDGYFCEWTTVVRDPALRASFRHFASDRSGDETVAFVPERGQKKPDDRPRRPNGALRRLPLVRRQWVRVASVADVPRDGGIAVRYGRAQLALFHFASRGQWYATQNLCPHKEQMVLARGILGDQGGTPKVACPLHKKTFDLTTGACLSGEPLEIVTFAVRVDGDQVLVELPPAEELVAASAAHREACASAATAS